MCDGIDRGTGYSGMFNARVFFDGRKFHEAHSHILQFPTAGSFPHFATRFVDPALGFTLAISYGYCYTIAIASEVSAAAVVVVRSESQIHSHFR